MKIAISGSHRTGKSSLAEELSARMPDYLWVPEPYFMMEELGYSFLSSPGIEDYLEQLEFSMKQLQTNRPNVIFDRSPLDFLAYLRAIGAGDIAAPLYTKVLDTMDYIDLLIFIPIESPDEIGCPGDEMPVLRRDVDEILSSLISEVYCDYLIVTGSVNERIRKVLSKIV